MLRTFRGDEPTSTAVAHGQDQVAYSWDGDLYVFDLDDVTSSSDPATRRQHRVAHGEGELMWPAFAPDDRSIAVRHDPGASAPGRVHVVSNHRGSSTPVRSGGATQLEVPGTPGAQPNGFDASGPLLWTR